MRSKMNLDALEKIAYLTRNGINATKAADFAGISASAAQQYARIIKAIDRGEEFSINPNSYNTRLIEAYCAKYGKEVPRNTYAGIPEDQQTRIEDILCETAEADVVPEESRKSRIMRMLEKLVDLILEA